MDSKNVSKKSLKFNTAASWPTTNFNQMRRPERSAGPEPCRGSSPTLVNLSLPMIPP
jgi:hypothetical protein